MCKVTISAFQLLEKFPNEESARLHIERIRWNGKPVCPRCNADTKQYPQNRKNKPGYYECSVCELVYTVRTGTIFERSHIPLHKWLFAMYLFCTARKGVSSLQLSKELGIGQNSAWFLLKRIRVACEDDNAGIKFLSGIIESDETFIGGIESNKHDSKKTNDGQRGSVGKTVVLGMRERGGKTKLEVIPHTGIIIKKRVRQSVTEGSTLCTDTLHSYKNMPEYNHLTVKHSAKQYVDGMAHTNGVESVWAVLKRAFYGTYHSFSKKHMTLYLNEVCFRLNSGNVEIHTLDRMDSLISMCFGKRLKWVEVTA